MNPGQEPPRVSTRIGLTSASILALLVIFAIYVFAEKQIDRANEQRHASYRLADELRQSSDDLTRMVRSYVMTGDPRFKTYFQDIVGIRNGTTPRPSGYDYVYWELVIAGKLPAPDGSGSGVALLEMMRLAGASGEELEKFAEAKTNSDDLTAIEFGAMRLSEAAGPDARARQDAANQMLWDKNYLQAKAKTMQPINEFYAMMDKRTLATVNRWIGIALAFRLLFIATTLGAIFALWRTYVGLRTTLGGTVDEVHAHILRIGRGDFVSGIAVDAGMENSILAGLLEMQNRLHATGTERAKAESALRESENRYRAYVDHAVEAIFVHDFSGKIIDVNGQACASLGYSREELANMTLFDVETELDPAATQEAWSRIKPNEGLTLLGRQRRKDGTSFPVDIHFGCFDQNGLRLYMGLARDITERVHAEEQLRIAAAAFNSQEAIIITDADNVILRVNRVFSEITGYSAEEIVGQTPHILESGRYDADFYREMKETIDRTGVWQGEIWDKRKNGEEYPKWLTISAVKDDSGAVTHFVRTHFDITARKKAEEKINELAFFDQLTGLPNRILLLDRLRQTMTASSRNGSFGALLFLDIDKFKMLNDTLGHDVGDLLLQQVAQRLSTCVREGDTVARLGGDEFVVMLTGLGTSETDAAARTETVGEKILAALNQPYRLDDLAHNCTSSIGATLFRGHLASIEDLLKQADLAMYKSKEAGRNTLRFFDLDMEVAVMKRVALENDLRTAIGEEQFLLHYQAQISEGKITGAEVLVRWQHPQRGMVAPSEFIPLAEETEMILPLGAWVLHSACSRLARWATRPELAQLTVAVNVSAHQFRQADFVDQVLAVLERTGADPQRLKLELTESLLVANVDDIIGKMSALKNKGVGFSLDDFGTGYSSLTYLKRLPLDQLKIDQSFVREVLTDANDASIARTIIALGQGLGLGVIAEGVETEEQRAFLAAAGCHAYQGYFFSRPLPVEKFEEFVQDKQR